MKILKLVTLITTSILLSLFMQAAQAEYVNLDKEKILGVGICHMFKKTYPCRTVEQKGKTYIVVLEKKVKSMKKSIK